ncbi:MAG: chemotaxis protein CheW [Gemmatimonadaceae bacterium]
MALNSADEEGPVMSIEDFAASIAASLATSAQPFAAGQPTEERHLALSFRERVQGRLGLAQLLVFRVAGELFAVELVTAEEALDMPTLHRLPEMPPTMLGVFTLRGALVSVFAPYVMLGIACRVAATAVVFCGGERRVAIATDDVDDVVTVDLETVRDAPGARAKDGALLGIVHRGTDLIALLDAEMLIAAYRPVTVALPEPVEERV